jgi:alpha-beta hydrolase superfamily lysophospholipase
LILSGPLLALAGGLYPRLRHLAVATAKVAPRLRVARISFDRLSRVRQVVERLHDDPLMFHGRFTVRVAAEILRAMKIASRKAVSLSVPLLILHGGRDQICDPAGSLALYQNAACADKTFHLYEGFYHEVFDEPQGDRVLADLAAWLDQRVPSADAAACRKQAEV